MLLSFTAQHMLIESSRDNNFWHCDSVTLLRPPAQLAIKLIRTVQYASFFTRFSMSLLMLIALCEGNGDNGPWKSKLEKQRFTPLQLANASLLKKSAKLLWNESSHLREKFWWTCFSPQLHRTSARPRGFEPRNSSSWMHRTREYIFCVRVRQQ